MKKSVAMKWVKALRSGKYKQGEGALKRTSRLDGNDMHCCLGVLCDISKQGEWSQKPDSFGYTDYHCINDSSDITIPLDVKKWAGMKSEEGERGGKKSKLVKLNDDSGYTFKQIANIIEKEWKDL